MKTCSLSIFLALILACPSAFAQLAQNDIGTHSMVYKYNDAAKIGETKTIQSYADVHGKYLWSKEWHRALVIMKPGNSIAMKAVKLNFYTNEIHYPAKQSNNQRDNQDEMAASISNVKRIIVYSNDPSDTTTVVATFDVLPNLETRKDFFYEVMNDGKIQLLKRVRISSNKMSVDPIQNREVYYFYSKPDYFIRNQAILKPIKALNKSKVFEVIPNAAASKEWLSSNRNKLKNEKDVVAFLNYLNSQGK